jgi:SulP family sulfate permease
LLSEDPDQREVEVNLLKREARSRFLDEISKSGEIFIGGRTVALRGSGLSFDEVHVQEAGMRSRLSLKEEAAKRGGTGAVSPDIDNKKRRSIVQLAIAGVVTFFPILGHIARYDWRTSLAGDLASGLTIGAMLTPQSIGYAALAHMSPEAGLFSGAIPVLVYGLVGGSRQVSVGPVAVLSLLIGNLLSGVAKPGTADYKRLTSATAFLGGLLMVILGILRLGFILQFLAFPVISGFITASGFLIILSQFKTCLGFSIPDYTYFFEGVYRNLAKVPHANKAAVVTSLITIVLLVSLRLVRTRFPKAKPYMMWVPDTVIVVILGCAISYGLQKHTHIRQPLVGKMPNHISSPVVPSFSREEIGKLAPAVIIITVVGFLESISMATHFARVNGYTIDGNRELMALGASNFCVSLFGGFSVTGSFSRSAENAYAGSTTTVSSLIASAVVFFVIYVATPALFYLPKAVLGGLIVVAAYRLMQWGEAKTLWTANRLDFAMWVITMLLTLAVGVEIGIGTSVGISLIIVFYKMSRPHDAVLGRLPGTETHLDICRFPHAITEPGIVIYRFDAPLFFANTAYFADRLDAVLKAFSSLQVLILDMGVISFIDTNGINKLKEFAKDLKVSSRHLLLCCVHGPVRDALRTAGFIPHYLTETRMLLSVSKAVSIGVQLRDGVFVEQGGAVSSTSDNSSLDADEDEDEEESSSSSS